MMITKRSFTYILLLNSIVSVSRDMEGQVDFDDMLWRVDINMGCLRNLARRCWSRSVDSESRNDFIEISLRWHRSLLERQFLGQ